MIRVMLDSDSIEALLAAPGGVPIAATYADLLTAAALAELAKKYAAVVSIDRGLGDLLGQASAIDVERGALTPAQAPARIKAMAARGVQHPTVYCDRSNLTAVDDACSGLRYARWVATLDGTCSIPGYTPLASPAAVQILPAASVGIHADLSLVFEPGWNPTPQPVSPQAITYARTLASDAAGLVKLLGA